MYLGRMGTYVQLQENGWMKVKKLCVYKNHIRQLQAFTFKTSALMWQDDLTVWMTGIAASNPGMNTDDIKDICQTKASTRSLKLKGW